MLYYTKELDFSHDCTIERLNCSQRQSSIFTSHLTNSSATFKCFQITACLYWTRCLGLIYAICKDNAIVKMVDKLYVISIH